MSKYIRLEDAISVIQDSYLHCESKCESCEYKEYAYSNECGYMRGLSDLPTIEVSEDCISREWVLKAIDAEDVGTPDEMWRPAREYVEMIKNAPSVVMKDHSGEPTEMVGEWLHKRMPHDSYHITGQCSICKERSRINNYCPWCGAKMKG